MDSLLLTPPTAEHRLSRSSELITRGAVRFATWSMIWVGQIVHIDDSLADAGTGELVRQWSSKGLPGYGRTSGFGTLVGERRMRTPRPAASTMLGLA